jgi:hypothetical protein
MAEEFPEMTGQQVCEFLRDNNHLHPIPQVSAAIKG